MGQCMEGFVSLVELRRRKAWFPTLSNGKTLKIQQWNKHESTWQVSAVGRVVATTQYSQLISPVFFFFKDVCSLKSHRKCHYTHPREFVNSLFETLRQEKAIFKRQNLLYHEYLLPNVSCSCKNLRRCNFLQ